MNEGEEHDALLRAALEQEHEGTPLGLLADWYQEHGLPGASVLRAGMWGRQYGFQDIVSHEDISSLYGTRGVGWIPHDKSSFDAPGSIRYEVIRRLEPIREPKTSIYLRVIHTGITDPNLRADYRIPILSKRHLREVMADAPHHIQNEVYERADAHLSDDHVEQYHRRRAYARRMSRNKK